jgi:nitroreductase
MNPVLENIFTRRSIRDYVQKQITDEELETILKAGYYAPSGMNHQSWHFVVVQKKEIFDRICEGVGRNPFYNANTLVLVFTDQTKCAPMSDGCLALENMMLAAHSIGIGSCWINCVKEYFKSPAGLAMKKEFGLGDEYECIGSVILGYPNEKPEPKPRKENVITYVR